MENRRAKPEIMLIFNYYRQLKIVGFESQKYFISMNNGYQIERKNNY